MKYFLSVIFGLSLGIFGDRFIPNSHAINITRGCYKTDQNVVFIPQTWLYDGSNSYPFYSPNNGAVKSYAVAIDILTGRINPLSQEECNFIKSEIKKGL